VYAGAEATECPGGSRKDKKKKKNYR